MINGWRVVRSSMASFSWGTNCAVILNDKLYYVSGSTLRSWSWGDMTYKQEATGIANNNISAMVVHGGKIYASTTYTPTGTLYGGKLLRWETGETSWTEVAPIYNDDKSYRTIIGLIEYNSKIYGVSFNSGRLLEWEVGNIVWTERTDNAGAARCLVNYDSKIYGVSSNGTLFKWETGETSWTTVSNSSNTSASSQVLVAYNNKIFYSDLLQGDLYSWETGDSVWTKEVDVTSNDCESLLVFNDKIYSFGYENGYLWSFSAGDSNWTQEIGYRRPSTVTGEIFHPLTWKGSIFAFSGSSILTPYTSANSDNAILGPGITI